MKRLLVLAAAGAGAAYAALEAKRSSEEQKLWAEATDTVPARGDRSSEQ